MKTPSHLNRSLAAAVAAISLTAAPAFASCAIQQQDPQRERAQPQDSRRSQEPQDQKSWQPNLVRHDKIIGATIHHAALQSATGTDGASGTDRGNATGANTARGDATRADEDAAIIGEVTDLILSKQDGSIEFAVITPGDDLNVGDVPRLVAWDRIHYQQMRGDECRVVADLNAGDMRRLATFNRSAVEESVKEARRRKSESDAESGGATGIAEADGAKQRETGLAEAGADKMKPKNGEASEPVSATLFVDYTVMAGNEDIGSIDYLWIETGHGQVAFATVGTGGLIGIGETERPVPWSAFQWKKEPGAEQPTLHLSKSKAELEKAPKLGDDERSIDLTDRKAREKVYSFYGVQKPRCEHPMKKQDGDPRGYVEGSDRDDERRRR